MIDDLTPYSEYKESGLPCLGQVPKHWEVRQARHIGRLFKGVGGTKEDAVPIGVPCVRYGELYTMYTYFIRANKAFISADLATRYTPIQYGDVLFAASGETIEEIGKSAVNLMQTTAVCGGDVIVLRPNIPAYAPFLGYAMDCRAATNQKATMGRGTTVKHIYPDELRGLLIPLPTLDEQAAIARFLDWANGRLERTIRAKRQLIALLNEQKQAIIHRAITQGLDPTAPLKPSGVDWIGTIPEHWKLKRFKYLTKIASGQVDPRVSPYREMVLIAPNHIQKATGKLLMEETADEQGADSGKYLVKAGEIVYSKIRPNLQKATIALRDCLCSADMYAIQPHPSEMEPEYLLALMLSRPFTQYVVDSSMRVAMPKVNRDALSNAWLWYPDVAEQHQILSSIRHEISSFDTSITQATREIDLIREYRTRLVADVVTGQLDVRHLDLPNVDEGSIGLIDESDDLADVLDDDLVEAVV